MTEYRGLDESALRYRLDDCSSFEERRKIRAALRQLKEGVVRAHSFHLGSTNTLGSNRDISQESRHFRRPTLGTASPLHSHQPAIRTTSSQSKAPDNLAGIRRSLNLALTKTVKAQESCSVEFQNGVATSKESDSAHVFNSGLPPARQLTNGLSVLKNIEAYSGFITQSKLSDRIDKHRACEESVGTDVARIDGSEVNCCSEIRLQQLLSKSTDFAERRKLRNSLRQLREEQTEGEPPTPTSMKLTLSRPNTNRGPAPSLNIDYDKIDTLEEFKTLLSVTDDYEEKRKIRNAMRQLRKRLELEKVKLSAGHKSSVSVRCESEDPGVRRASIAEARRRLSEDVARSSLSSLLTRQDTHVGSEDSGLRSNRVSKDLGPRSLRQKEVSTQHSQRVSGEIRPRPDRDSGLRSHRVGKTSATQKIDKVRKGNPSLTKTDKKTEVKSSHLTHLPLQQRNLQSAKDEDFLGQIKARLSTHEKFVSGNEEERKAILTNTAKSNLSEPKTNTRYSGDISRHFIANSAKPNKQEEDAFQNESVKVIETQLVANKSSHQVISEKNKPTYKSSLLVKLNSDKKQADPAGKFIVNTKSNIASNKQLFVNLDKQNEDSHGYLSDKSALHKEISVLDNKKPIKTISSGKDGIELHLTTVNVSQPLHENEVSVSTESPGSTPSAVQTYSPPSKLDRSPASDTSSSEQTPSQLSAHPPYKPLIFTVDPRPKGKGLFRSHSDVLPGTGSGYRRVYQSQCQPAKPLQSKSDMEKAFVDMLQDMDAERLVDASDTSAQDRDRTPTLLTDYREETNRLGLSAIHFVDDKDSNVNKTPREDRAMAADLNTLSECDEPQVAEEENNNVPGKLMKDVTDSSDMTLVLLGEGCTQAPGVGESAITLREENDGTTTVQQVSRTNTQDQTVTVKSKMYRTPSNAQAEERDTIVETTSSSPGGSTLKERDVVRTRKKITSRGSNYYQRSVQVTRRVKDQSGNELVHQDLCLESDNKSVSQGQSWGDRVVTQVTLHQPAYLQNKLVEGTAAPKRSHATLVLNKLNLSKASSGYGSRSGSEEEDREEILDVNNSRPKGCPEIRHALQDIEVDVGEEIRLECGVVADPTPSVSWYSDGEELKEGDPRYTLHQDPDTACLTVHSSRVSTQYRCVFRNQHGQAETRCSVTLREIAWKQGHQPPEQSRECSQEQDLQESRAEKMSPGVDEDLQDVVVTEGHSLTLSCRLSHADSVLWYHDNTLLTHCQDFKQSYDCCLAKLEISEMFLDDNGEYSCVGRNPLGEACTACQVSVTACDSEVSVVPMFLTQLESKSLSVGDKLILECDIIGSPQPDLTWTKDGCPLRDDCAYNEMFDGRTAILEIEDLQVVDSGRYDCVAVNEAGKVSNDARITVTVKNKKPSVTTPLSDVSIRSGETAVLECHMTGFPQPTIIWRKNGMMIGQTKDFKQTYEDRKATLEICSACVQDSGQYECLARNTSGETSTASSLTVTNVSSPGGAMPASSATIRMTSPSPTRPSHIPLTSSSSQPGPTASTTSPSSPLHSNIISRALTRSASHHITSRSSSPPQTIIQRSIENVKLISPTSETSCVPGSVEVVSMDTRSKPLSSMKFPLSGKAAPQNTIGKFLALAAARDLEGPKSYPLRTSLETKLTDSGQASRDVSHITKSDETPRKPPASKDVNLDVSTQHLSKVQQLRLQFLKGGDKSQSSNSNSAPIRRWHSLPPQDLRPTIIEREHQEPGGGKKRPANMPSYDDINDEEELMKIMSKTDDFDERKKLRARLKEVREKDKLDREARRQQREKEAGDVVKQKFEKAEEDKRRRMQQFSDMAVKPGPQTTTETKTGADGSSTTTTTTTSTSKTQDGGTRMQTVKKTETTITKTSGLGGVQYTKPGAEETARKLSDHLKTVGSPGTSGRIAVTTESWSSRDGLHHKSEKTETWGAKPGGARGAMAAFKQLDATNSPAQPNALVTVTLAKKAANTVRRNAIAIKQEVLTFCKENTREYQNIEITNFSSCWNNGIAFCALIHHFFPDAFDYYALNPKNRRYNFDLAFDTAEKMADIAPLLDTDDMVKMKNPDWKCVFTYVQSIYRHLREHDANKAKEQ